MNTTPTLRVVGAGFGRTGTLSLKRALEILGFGPCYHMEEVMKHPEHVPVWEAATRGEAVDWRALYAGWGATVDWPSCAFYQEILAAHPDAKVILSRRDPQRWHQSVMQTIYLPSVLFPMRVLMPYLPRVGPATRMAAELVWKRTFGGRVEEREHAKAVFEAHCAAVIRTIPAERLLVYEPGQGWGPLCEFLGVPVPDQPYPHVNDTASMGRMIRIGNAVLALLATLPVVGLGAALWAWLR
ncbi:MAG TPA: sulfotransferase [Myxococcota bacterium]|nr:sulfotransferase [Myxococcota bacterium]